MLTWLGAFGLEDAAHGGDGWLGHRIAYMLRARMLASILAFVPP
jgi:hypothetical protein